MEIKLLFCGDLAPTSRNKELLLNDVDLFLNIKDDIKNSDLSFANLELPLTNSNHKIKKNGPCLKANPLVLKQIKNAGFDLLGLANNHIMDYGKQGLSDTLNYCKTYDIDTVGAGKNISDSQKIYYKNVKHKTIAIIAIAENEFSIAQEDKYGAAPLDLIDNYNQIIKAKENADFVILTLHAGNEYFQYPRPLLRKTCKYFIDLGVDSVICHHTHTIGAYEIYKDKFITYGLGNFLFDTNKNKKYWNQGYMLQLIIDGEKLNYKIIPYTQHVDNPGIVKLKGDDKKEFFKNMEQVNAVLKNDELWMKEWYDWCNKNHRSYIVNSYLPIKFRGIGLLTRNINLSKILTSKGTIPTKLNMIQCESHREVLTTILKNKMDRK